MTTNRPEFKEHDDFIFEHKEIGKVTREEFIKYIRSSHEHMRKLSKLIQQYNQTIDGYLDEWDGRFESFDDDVKYLLHLWIQDGTMDHIINENLMNSKADKTYVDDLNENVTAQLAQTEQENDKYNAQIIKDLNIINPEHLNNWRAKRARMLDEDVKAKIAFWGDSITEGFFATYPLTLETKRTKTFVGLLNQYYKNTVGDVGLGYAQTMVSGTSDTHSEWSWDNGFTVEQGIYTRASIRSRTIGSVATLPFEGVGIDIVLIRARFYGLAKIYVDDNYIKSVDLETGTTTQEIHIERIEGLVNGEHVLKIEHETGSFLSIIGALPIKGSKGVVTMNFSRSGDTTDRLNYNVTAIPNYIKTSLGLFDPDVVCIGYHTNDAGHNTGIGTYIERLSVFVDKALENGSEVILIAQSARRDTVLTSKTVAYRNAMRSVAIEKGVCMVDWTGRWLYGNEIDKIASYLYDSDHYNEAGHQDMFEMLVRALEM